MKPASARSWGVGADSGHPPFLEALVGPFEREDVRRDFVVAPAKLSRRAWRVRYAASMVSIDRRLLLFNTRRSQKARDERRLSFVGVDVGGVDATEPVATTQTNNPKPPPLPSRAYVRHVDLRKSSGTNSSPSCLDYGHYHGYHGLGGHFSTPIAAMKAPNRRNLPPRARPFRPTGKMRPTRSRTLGSCRTRTLGRIS
jgi:hypothetical protein